MHGQMHVGRAAYVLTAVVLRTLLHCNLGRKPSCSHPFHLLQQSGTTRRPWKRPPMLVLRWRCWLRNHDQDQHSSHLCLCGLLTFSSLLVCVSTATCMPYPFNLRTHNHAWRARCASP
ncbi:hypothetical protein GQ607_000210 [Colletotrichum asianum]|uniref:Secreted protein n=1 Tax=Colletotrichum asianum TaxID=702518 RepID=A0A8H3WS90_9PEZI|nr:hypothetical protein GQ607_000210 [Colletotrichum asianum]